ncbi:MAG: hypothetical protein JXR83_12395, partial [Deltaproteobacteria bacterium]|nr:hypothetical protein [Deltaproteobacteria bacterium]
LAALLQPASAPPGALEASAVKSGEAKPLQFNGPLRALDSPVAILDLRLSKPPDPRTLSANDLLSLLNGLCLIRASGTLSVKAGHAHLELPFRGGAIFAADDEVAQIPKLAAIAGQYQFVPTVPAKLAPEKKQLDPRFIVATALQLMLRLHPMSSLEAGLGSTLQRYPKPLPNIPYEKRGHRFNAKEQRFLTVVMDGTYAMSMLPRISGLMRAATYRFMYVLIIYDFLALNEEPEYAPDRDPRTLFVAECERLLNTADPFEVVGVHWSEHPNGIRAKLERRLERFDANGKFAKFAPDLARQVHAKVMQCAEQILTVEGRTQARQALGDFDPNAAASILAKHAETNSMRGKLSAAAEYMEMAIEICPTDRYRELMRIYLGR